MSVDGRKISLYKYGDDDNYDDDASHVWPGAPDEVPTILEKVIKQKQISLLKLLF